MNKMGKDIFHTLIIWLLGIIFYKYDSNNILNDNRYECSEIYGCPVCDAEYLSHILTCSDCGEELVKFFYEKWIVYIHYISKIETWLNGWQD